MNKFSKFLKHGKRLVAIMLVLFMNINSYAAIGANDGSAFVTKAEFDALVNTFNEQMDNYEDNMGSKLDGAIANYLASFSNYQNIPLEFESRYKNIRWIRTIPLLISGHVEQNKGNFDTRYNDGISVNYYMVDFFNGQYRQAGTLNTSFTGGAKTSSNFTGWTNRPTYNNNSFTITLDENKTFGYLRAENNYSYYYWTTSGNGWLVSQTACGSDSTSVRPEIKLLYDSYGRLVVNWKPLYYRGSTTSSTYNLFCTPRLQQDDYVYSYNPKYYMIGVANNEEYICVPYGITQSDTSKFSTWFSIENAEIKNSSGTNILTNAGVTLNTHDTNGPVVTNTAYTLTAMAIRSKKWPMRNWYNDYLREQNLPKLRLYEGIPIIESLLDTGVVTIDMEVAVYNKANEAVAEEAIVGLKNDKWDNSDLNNGTIKYLDDDGSEKGNAERLETKDRKIKIRYNGKKFDPCYIKMYPKLTDNGKYVRILSMNISLETE